MFLSKIFLWKTKTQENEEQEEKRESGRRRKEAGEGTCNPTNFKEIQTPIKGNGSASRHAHLTLYWINKKNVSEFITDNTNILV